MTSPGDRRGSAGRRALTAAAVRMRPGRRMCAPAGRLGAARAVIMAAARRSGAGPGDDRGMAPRTYERRGTHGAAASTHHLATSTAMAVLARGGNAFDAAVAGGFVLQVVEPHMCGPGGEVPAVFVTAGDPTPRVLCAQGVAPGRATTALLRDELGLAASPAPGCSRPPCPARGTAGSPCCATTAPFRSPTCSARPSPTPSTASRSRRRCRRRSPPSSSTCASTGPARRPRGCPTAGCPPRPTDCPPSPRPGAGCSRRPSGPTREAQIDAARAAWYRGFVAEAIEEFVATPVRDATGRDHAGLLTADDLAGWSCSYEDAVVVEAGGGWAVAKPGPWSQGPVLAQTLQLLRDADLEYVDGVPSEARVHRVAEAAKLAFADREAWYGDSAPVPLEALVSRGVRRRAAGPHRGNGVDGAAARRPRRGRPAAGRRHRPRRLPRRRRHARRDRGADGRAGPGRRGADRRRPSPPERATRRRSTRRRTGRPRGVGQRPPTHGRVGHVRRRPRVSRRAGYGRRRTGWSLGADGRVGCGRCRRAGWSLGADG